MSTVYKDLYKVQNVCIKYKSLIMKPTKTFVNFYTYFLYLARQGKILQDDLYLDLFNKLTIELQYIIL